MKTVSRYKIFSLILVVLISTIASAQDPHPSYKHYTVEDGLPSSEVYQVKQDSKGYIWFATANGVSRFNGYEFENFSLKDGLPDNTVFELFEDTAGRIWFIPVSCKLSYYYKGRIHPFKYNDTLQQLLNNPIKMSFGVDKKGTVFLGVAQDGIYEIKENGSIHHYFSGKDTLHALNVIEPDVDCLIYSTNNQEYSNTALFNTSWLQEVLEVKENLMTMYASDKVIKTKDKRTIITCSNRLHVFTGRKETEMKVFPDRIIALYEDRQSDLWVGTYLGGVYYFNRGDLTRGRLYLGGMPVNGILEDREGGFWFATEGNGVFYTPSKNTLTYDKSSGFADDKINCLIQAGAVLYAGTGNGHVVSIAGNTIYDYDLNTRKLPTNGITALYNDERNARIMVSGMSSNGYIKDKVFRKFKEFGNFKHVIYDGNNIYWMANSRGFNRSENGEKSLPSWSNGKSVKRVNAFIKMDETHFLVGAMDGLWKFNKKTEDLTYLGNKHPLLTTRILDMDMLPSGSVIIATKGNGLLIYDMKDSVRQLNVSNELFGDNVYRVISYKEEIWAGTNKGLNRIIFKNEKAIELANYTTSEGMPSNEINDLLKQGQLIWVATNKGLTFFSIEEQQNAVKPIPVYINKLTVNDSVVDLQSNYELQYSENNIKIDFIGLGYKQAGKLLYRYKMEGLDTAWTYTTGREVQFTTLPPNKYSFILSVQNPGGKWSDSPYVMHFIIHKPFWQKWWFLLSVFVIVLFVILLFFRYRINMVKDRESRRSELNKAFLNLKLKALRAQMNPHFTFNVMNSIQHFILEKDTESAHRYLSKFSKLIRTILNNSEHNTISVADEIKALELYLELEAMRFEEGFVYEIMVDESINVDSTYIPSMLIQPYVENAVKHGIFQLKVKGRVKIEILREDMFLKCVIEDNGVGRTRTGESNRMEKHKSMGTSITQERLLVLNELNNSNLSERVIDLVDVKGESLGTRVEIYIPVKN